MDQEKIGFLLDLLISQSISRPTDDPVNFILYYRLDEKTSVKIMDEVHKIADEVKGGTQITFIDVLNRIGSIHQPVGPMPPESFVADAIKVWAPEIWDQIENM